ncbi:MAG: 50S ribosomal protein L5 [Candidatus Aminicenantes bacterium]|nr:50S ribosomal protein L5 [Candidatus Aminicenantes bacterium]
MSRLYEKYRTEVVPELREALGIANVMAVPRLEKIIVNVGAGDAIQNSKLLDTAKAELGLITGQLPAISRAKKSISSFKLRKGQPIACFVTLRGRRMYEFFDRLVNIVLPRVRDFRGVPPTSFDGRGNYTLGMRDQLVFPEIDYTKVERPRGMNITIVTTARTDEESRALLKRLGMPFRESLEAR